MAASIDRNLARRAEAAIRASPVAVGVGFLCVALLLSHFVPRDQTLALPYAQESVRRAPILALPGTSPEKLEQAINQLRNTQEKLAALQESEKEKQAVLRALYPIDFLRSLAKLERARLRFVESGNETDYSAYLDSTRAALTEYRKSLVAFRAAFLDVVPENTPAYATASGRIDRAWILTTVDALLKHERDMHEQLRRFERCVSGTTSACDEVTLAMPTPSLTAGQNLDAADLALARSIVSQYKKALRGSAIREPMIAMEKGACTISLPGSGLFVLAATPVSGDPNLSPMYVGDLRLVESAAHTSIPFYDYFNDKGVVYVPSPPLTHYSCPQLGDEFGRLLAIRAIIDTVINHPLSKHAENSKNALEKIGVQLAQPLVRESDAITYLREGLRLADAHTLDAEIENEIISLALQLERKSAQFDEQIRYVARVEEAIIAAAERGAPGALDAAILFYVRNALPLWYPHDRVSLEAAPASEGQPFVFFGSLTPEKMKNADLVNSIAIFEALHAPLAE